MRILDRLVAFTFLRLFTISMLATPPLFILGDITENLDQYIDRGLTGVEVAQSYLYQLPQYFQWSFPIAALIAAVFTVHSMTVHREIVAAKAGGVSFHRLVAPILLLGILLTGAALWLTWIVPLSNRQASAIQRNELLRPEWRSDFVYQTEDGLSLSARRLTVSDGRLTGIVLQRPASDSLPAVHVQAENGMWTPNTGWTFTTGRVRLLEHKGEEQSWQFTRLRMTGLTEDPEDLLQEPREEEEMTYEEIDRLARLIERSGGEPHELRVKREQKLAIPVATFVIILFGLPLATSSKRGGTAYGVGVSLGSTILYLMLLKVAGGFGASGALPPLWAAWLPNAVFLLAGIALMFRVRT